MAKTIKVAVVGYGISAQVFHLPFVTTIEGYELVSILERSKSESKEKYPQARIVRTIDELVADPEPDLVVVTTPNDTHFEYASKALRAGKHVVLEKPFTNTLEEGRELIRIANESGKTLSVYHNRRYVSDFLTIRDLLDKKVLGEVHEYTCHFDRYRPEAKPQAWREEARLGSGILYDLGPHLIDQALVLFGKPLSITADIRFQRPHAKADDYFDIWLNFGFAKARLHSSMLVREMGPRYMVNGTKGSFIKYGDDPQEVKLKEGAKPVGDDWGMEPEEFAGLLHTEIDGEVVRRYVPSFKGDFGYYYRNLLDTLVNHAPLLEKPEHGYNTIVLIGLAQQSSKEMKTIECSGLL